MKKILLSCVTCLLALGLVTACDDEVEDVTPEDPNAGVVEPGGDDGGGSGTGDGSGSSSGGESFYVLGVEVGTTLNYITGETPSDYAYEGTLTTDISKAVPVTYEQGSDNEYYVSFELEEVPYWVTIIEVEGTDSDNNPTTHINLSYATEKSALYLHTTDAGAEYLGNEDGSYFLCYYSRFSCLYASAISYLETSPVAGIYSNDGTLLLGGKSPVTAPEAGNPEGTHTHDVVVTSPDNKGVYVLGYETEEGDAYLVSDGSAITVTSTYSEATSVTTLVGDDGVTLLIGEKYLGVGTDNDGVYSLALVDNSSDVAVVSVGNDGVLATNESLSLVASEDGKLIWVSEVSELVPVVLMDVAYDHDVAAIEDSEGLVFGFLVDGEYLYFDGTHPDAYVYRGIVTNDIHHAVSISLDNVSDNAYYMTFELEGTTYYIGIGVDTNVDNNTHMYFYEEPTAIYYDETTGKWTDSSKSYFLAYQSSSGCLYAAGISTSAPIATLYYPETVPALRGVVITAESDIVPISGTLTLSLKFYPTCIMGEDIDATWTVSEDGTYATIDDGVVIGIAAGNITVSVSFDLEGSAFSDSIDLAVEASEITTVITAETIMEEFDKEWTTNTQVSISSTTGVTSTYGGCTVTWYTGTETGDSNNGVAIYNSSLRIYKGSHFDIAPVDGYEITSTEVYTSSYGSNLTCTGAVNATWVSSSYTWVTEGPSVSDAPIVYAYGTGSNTPVIGTITIVATPVTA